MGLLKALSIACVSISIGYFILTGMVWLIVWLVQESFGVKYSGNIWMLSFLVWVVAILVRLLFVSNK
jgi:hypothetical protein